MHIVTPLSRHETAVVTQLVDDLAADHHQPSPRSGTAAVRGLLGHNQLRRLAARHGLRAVNAVVEHRLAENPAALTAPPAARVRSRRDRAERASNLARYAERRYLAGDQVAAGELLDQATLIHADLDVSRLRALVNAAVAAAGRCGDEPQPRPGDEGLDLWKILAATIRLDPGEPHRVTEGVLESMKERNSIRPTDGEIAELHRVAEHHAVSAYGYVRAPGAVDAGPGTSAATALLRCHSDAVALWRQRGVPRGHIADPGLHAAVTAADMALTWSMVSAGWLHSVRRLDQITPATVPWS